MLIGIAIAFNVGIAFPGISFKPLLSKALNLVK